MMFRATSFISWPLASVELTPWTRVREPSRAEAMPVW